MTIMTALSKVPVCSHSITHSYTEELLPRSLSINAILFVLPLPPLLLQRWCLLS